MAAKGVAAKENFIKRLAEALGEDYIGEYNKAYYVWSKENGQRTQIKLSLTIPKDPIEIEGVASIPNTDSNGDWDWSSSVSAAPAKPAEITQQEVDNLQALLAKLGL